MRQNGGKANKSTEINGEYKFGIKFGVENVSPSPIYGSAYNLASI